MMIIACPSCGDTDETIEHMFQCPRRHAERSRFISRLDRQLKTLDTAADIRIAIVTGIQHWIEVDDTARDHQ